MAPPRRRRDPSLRRDPSARVRRDPSGCVRRDPSGCVRRDPSACVQDPAATAGRALSSLLASWTSRGRARARRGAAANSLNGMSTWQPRRRRDPPPRNIHVAAATRLYGMSTWQSRPASTEYPRGSRGVVATRPLGRSAWHPSPPRNGRGVASAERSSRQPRRRRNSPQRRDNPPDDVGSRRRNHKTVAPDSARQKTDFRAARARSAQGASAQSQMRWASRAPSHSSSASAAPGALDADTARNNSTAAPDSPVFLTCFWRAAVCCAPQRSGRRAAACSRRRRDSRRRVSEPHRPLAQQQQN